MQLPPNDSPLWPLIRIAIVGTLTLIGVSVGYREGFVAKADLPVIVLVALGAAGIEGAAKWFFGEDKK